jgi:Zn-dependent M28 family amino/carboxypeptidase
MGAHLDSWDVGQGAIDDGAGCAIVLEAAHLLREIGQAPRRTVRVVLFAGEELGVSGGKAYAIAHETEAALHIVAMEADMGTAKSYAARFFGPPDRRAAFERIARLVTPLGVEIDSKDAFGGADMAALRRLGVPSFELAQDFSTYFDVHHTVNDTVERLETAGLAQSAAAYATVAWAVSEMEGDFGRVPEGRRAGH